MHSTIMISANNKTDKYQQATVEELMDKKIIKIKMLDLDTISMRKGANLKTMEFKAWFQTIKETLYKTNGQE
jgi:hypothetical protein